MRVEKKKKHLHIEFIVTSHNSVCLTNLALWEQSKKTDEKLLTSELNIYRYTCLKVLVTQIENWTCSTYFNLNSMKINPI